MRKYVAKTAIPVLFVIGSLGAGSAIAAVPAGAATRPAHKPPASALSPTATYKGTVKSVEASKDLFTLKDGSKSYVVFYRGAVKFTKGSAADIKVDAAITIKGNLVKGKTLIHATSISV
jgi:hypothetical protein